MRLSSPAFTLIELVVVVVLVGILAVLTVPVAQYARKKGELAVCSNNLRNLHGILGAYVQDQGHWPQPPEELNQDAAKYGVWWIKQTEPYGATPEVWTCPTLRRELSKTEFSNESERPAIHYAPTQFDDLALTPYKWETQPWLMEISDAHGGGNLILFPDGSVQGMQDAMRRIMRPREE